jgi:DNA-binding NarL/FixJ family response regulator
MINNKLFFIFTLDLIEQLHQVIVAVSQGQIILDPVLATFMFAGNSESPFLKQLTAREMEILNLLAQGFTNAAIAQALYIDIKTVEHHLNSMYGKLKVDSDFSSKHLRVSAAKLYLETMGNYTGMVLASQVMKKHSFRSRQCSNANRV